MMEGASLFDERFAACFQRSVLPVSTTSPQRLEFQRNMMPHPRHQNWALKGVDKMSPLRQEIGDEKDDYMCLNTQ